MRETYTQCYLRDLWSKGQLTAEQQKRLLNIGFDPVKRSAHREIVCLETGETFKTIKEAAAKLGSSPARIKRALKTGTSVTSKMLHFYYADEGKPEDSFFKNTSYGRPVTCFETGEVFESSGDAAKKYGLTSSAILTAISRRRSVGSMQLHFYFSFDPKPKIDDFCDPLRRSVTCFETGEVFESITEAEKQLGITNISRACANAQAAGGYHWYYADEPRPDPATFKSRAKKAVICYETGEVFASITEACQSLGLRHTTVTAAIKSGGTAGGYHWYYADEPKPDLKTLKHSRKRAVRCIETGEVFESQSEAARKVKVNMARIRAAIKRKGTCGGYHWEYIDSSD